MTRDTITAPAVSEAIGHHRRTCAAEGSVVTGTQTSGASIALGGEYGGFGANYKIWTGSGRVFWPF